MLKYDELLRSPLDVVKRAHDMLGVFTSQPKLTAFVKSHLDPNYTVSRDMPVDAPVVSMRNVSGGKVVVHKLRKRLKTEFGTVRPVSKSVSGKSFESQTSALRQCLGLCAAGCVCVVCV